MSLDSAPIVDIIGPIEKGDLKKIKKASSELILSLNEYDTKTLQFHLNTPGGNLEEAMQIGRFAREILADIDSYGKIIIAPGSKAEQYLKKDPSERRDYVVLSPQAQLKEEHLVRNYSAGVLAFYGGVKRAHRDNSDQRLGLYNKKSIPVMGIHRPYYDKRFFSTLSPAEASKAYKKLEARVRDYLKEMGAPQTIVDRMFNRASNKIDMIEDDEFRKYYKSEESFIEEWLIAKCGASGYNSVLEGKEAEDFAKIRSEQFKARLSDKLSNDNNSDYIEIYPSNEYAKSYIGNLYKKVRMHNYKVNLCRKRAIISHQRKWAENYDGN